MNPSPAELEQLRALLCRLQDHIRDGVIAARGRSTLAQLTEVAAETAADTIYGIDKVTESAIVDWFSANWPVAQPVEVVMEGVDDGSLIFPASAPVSETRWKAILDPIDGTRGLMYDKRAAWALAGIAPQRGPETNLRDIVVAAMTELPTTKQWRSDQLSAVRGCGPAGVVADSVDVRSGARAPFRPQPSRATDFRHGFASLAKFFPQGKTLLARIEEELWSELHGAEPQASPLVFDDQYISTGGQLYELAAGHDRMLGDLRPAVYRKLGLDVSLTCHPYDICTALILEELGVVVEAPDGGPIDAPLDTTSPIAWMGYANATLASLVRPVIRRLIEEHCGS